MRVWQPVIVSNEAHDRFNTAGTVDETNHQTHPNDVVVKFDADGSRVSMAISDLRALV
jgi:hypothetical protein